MARTKNRQNSSMVVNLPKNHRQNNKSRKTKFQTNLKHIVREQGGFKYWKKVDSWAINPDEKSDEVPDRAKPVHCLWCEEVFSSVKTLHKHVLCSRACRPYFCQSCGCRFMSLKRLAEHSKVHPKFPKKKYICRSCNERFEVTGMSHVLPGDESERFHTPSETPMEVDDDRVKRVEMQDSENEEEYLCSIMCMRCAGKHRISCPFCELTFPDIPSMTAHCVMHKGYFLYEYACDACERAFVSLPALEEHLSWHEEKSVFLCTVCGEKFSRIEDRESHRENHASCQNMGALMLKMTNQNYVAKKRCQPTASSFTALAYDCSKCDFTCNSKTAIKAHYGSEHPPTAQHISSSECAKKTLKSPETEINQEKIAPTNLVDEKHDLSKQTSAPSMKVRDTTKYDSLQQTSASIVESKLNDGLSRKGKKWKKKAAAAADASNTKNADTGDVDLEPIKATGANAPADKKNMPCPFCHKVLPTSHSLAQHCNVHTDYIFYETVCHMCGHQSNSVRNLSLHLSLHQQKTVNLCCICGIDCGKRDKLNAHINEDHNDITEVHRSLSKKTNPLFVNQLHKTHDSDNTGRSSDGLPTSSRVPGGPNVPIGGPSGWVTVSRKEGAVASGSAPPGSLSGPRPERAAALGIAPLGKVPGPHPESRPSERLPTSSRSSGGTNVSTGGPSGWVTVSRNEAAAAPGSGLSGRLSGQHHESRPSEGLPTSSRSSGGTNVSIGGPSGWVTVSRNEGVAASGSAPPGRLSGPGYEKAVAPGIGVPGRFPGPRPEGAYIPGSGLPERITDPRYGGTSVRNTRDTFTPVEVSSGNSPNNATHPNGSGGHLASKSVGEAPVAYHLCSVCGSSFDEKEKYVSHMRSLHKMPFICRFCDKSFSLIEGLATHCHEHPEFPLRGFRCNMCNIRFISLRSLEEHLSGHEGKRIFVCCLCGQIFDTITERASHENSHGKDKLPETQISNRGKTVPPRVTEERQMNQRNTMDTHTRPNSIAVDSTPTQVTIASHANSDNEAMDDRDDNVAPPGTSAPATNTRKKEKPPRQCKYCDLWFPAGIGRKKHQKMVHLLWRCKKCGAHLDRKEKLACHMRKRHAMKYTLLNLYCQTCKKFFNSLEELESDLSTHAGLPVFLCSICAMKFLSDQERDIHEESHKAII